MTDTSPIQTPVKPKWTAYQKYIIILLLLVYTINFIDRQIVAILSPAIKADLGLTDTQLGLLKGLAFALIYGFASFPIAWLADRKNRVTIVSVSVAAWSAMTAVCGVAQNFTQLIIARMGVGVGEAGCSPPAHSIISDYFPKDSRASAMGIYSLGIPLGTLFGILFGGLIAGTFGWRWAFLIVGLPGILLALIVKLTLKEPVRGAMESELAKSAQAESVPFLKSVSEMMKIKSYLILSIASTLTSFSGFAIGLWIVDFLFRSHELTYAQLTVPLALVMGVGGGIGTFFGGYITDYFARKDNAAYFVMPAVVNLISVPLYVAALWVGSPFMCFVCFFFVFMMHNSVAGPVYALVQNLAPVHLRAFAAALFFFLLSVIGFAFGPVYVGAVADALTPTMGEADGLRWALTSIAPVWGISALIMLYYRKALREDLG